MIVPDQVPEVATSFTSKNLWAPPLLISQTTKAAAGREGECRRSLFATRASQTRSPSAITTCPTSCPSPEAVFVGGVGVRSRSRSSSLIAVARSPSPRHACGQRSASPWWAENASSASSYDSRARSNLCLPNGTPLTSASKRARSTWRCPMSTVALTDQQDGSGSLGDPHAIRSSRPASVARNGTQSRPWRVTGAQSTRSVAAHSAPPGRVQARTWEAL